MSGRHTPGPWTVDSDRAILCESKTASGKLRPVAQSYSWMGSAEADANAALIAAAPDLLEALKAYVDWHGASHTMDCPKDECEAASIDAALNAAIRKAEGIHA